MITRYFNMGEEVLINKEKLVRTKRIDVSEFDFDAPYTILDFRVKNGGIEYYFGYSVVCVGEDQPYKMVPWDENKKRTFFNQAFLLKYYERKTIKNGAWDWTKISS